jgi:SHS2 domain-containing protein
MTTLRSQYFEHDADIGIIGQGATIEKAFEAAAQAVFAIVKKLDLVQLTRSLTSNRY